MNKETITENLHRGICTVTFTKVNGESRTMQCTLHPDYLPLQDNDSHTEVVLSEDGFSTDPQNPAAGRADGTIPVWDIESKGWRSFRLDSVTNFNSSTLLKG